MVLLSLNGKCQSDRSMVIGIGRKPLIGKCGFARAVPPRETNFFRSLLNKDNSTQSLECAIHVLSLSLSLPKRLKKTQIDLLIIRNTSKTRALGSPNDQSSRGLILMKLRKCAPPIPEILMWLFLSKKLTRNHRVLSQTYHRRIKMFSH